MNKVVLIGCMALLLTACGSQSGNEASQLIVLYKGDVAPGNSMVSFVNHNDPSGRYASEHCEVLRNLYSAREGIPYVCSTVVFPEFKPNIK